MLLELLCEWLVAEGFVAELHGFTIQLRPVGSGKFEWLGWLVCWDEDVVWGKWVDVNPVGVHSVAFVVADPGFFDDLLAWVSCRVA